MHLMSAGRLQLYEKAAGPRDRTSRLLVGLAGGRELRMREFGSKQAAWVRLVRTDGARAAGRPLRSRPRGMAGPAGRSRSFSVRRGPCTRCCATST